MTTTSIYDLTAERVIELAKDAGRGAATWVDTDVAAEAVPGIRCGDPEVLDRIEATLPVLRATDLDEVAAALDVDRDSLTDEAGIEIVEAVDRFNDAARDEFIAAVERAGATRLVDNLAEALDAATDAARGLGLDDDEILGALQDTAAKWDEDSDLVQGRGWTGVVEGSRSWR
jgi:adenylate kinase